MGDEYIFFPLGTVSFKIFSFVTAIELLGNPAEMYNHGSQYWVICIAFVLVIPLTSNLYLPVFMRLRLTSSYEYLSMRFNVKTRLFASGLYVFQMVLYTSVAVYAPALALSHGEPLIITTYLYYGCIIINRVVANLLMTFFQ